MMRLERNAPGGVVPSWRMPKKLPWAVPPAAVEVDVRLLNDVVTTLPKRRKNAIWLLFDDSPTTTLQSPSQTPGVREVPPTRVFGEPTSSDAVTTGLPVMVTPLDAMVSIVRPSARVPR